VPANLVQESVKMPSGHRLIIPRQVERNVCDVVPAGDERSLGPDWAAGDDRLETRAVPLGSLVGARSGDKGGDANVGLWMRSDEVFAWGRSALTVALIRQLIPESQSLPIDRYEFTNLRAVNFVIRGLLGEGVGASSRVDRQAKGLGEYLRSRIIQVPVVLLEKTNTKKGSNEYQDDKTASVA
jgi:hypothetical protein